MNVWVDIAHVAQYNFYRNIILKLAKENQVYVTVIGRGKLPAIVSKEIGNVPNIKVETIGVHKLTKKSVIWDVNIMRPLKLLSWFRGKHITVGLTNGYVGAMVCWLNGVPCYTFGDDPQTFDYKLKLWFAKQSHYCLYHLPKDCQLSPKVIILKALKEWSYLSPTVYRPNVKALETYNLQPKEYIFLREVSVGTINYTGQPTGAILNIQKFLPSNKKVLFSLEDKSKRNQYPKDWILLQEPVKDIHSLIYFAAGLVSSGDSMAREAALLGVPSYYLGIRHSMPANLVAAEVADFNNEISLSFPDWLKRISISSIELKSNQEKTISQIAEKFTDINTYIYSLIANHNFKR